MVRSVHKIIFYKIDMWTHGASMNYDRSWPSNGQLSLIQDRYLIVCHGQEIENDTCEMLDLMVKDAKWEVFASANTPNHMPFTPYAAVTVYHNWVIHAGGVL